MARYNWQKPNTLAVFWAVLCTVLPSLGFATPTTGSKPRRQAVPVRAPASQPTPTTKAPTTKAPTTQPAPAARITTPSKASSPGPTPARKEATPPKVKREKFQKPKLKGITKKLLSRRTFFWSQMIGMLFALGVVVLLIYVILRWAAQRAGLHGQGAGALLKVRDRLGLEAKKSLWVVEVAGQYLLLATHEQGVTLIERIDAEQAQKYLKQPDRQPSGFWDRLKRGSGTKAQQAAVRQKAQESVAEDAPTPDEIPTNFEVVSDGKTPPPSHE